MCPTPPSRVLLQPLDLNDEHGDNMQHEIVKHQNLKEKQATIALTQLTPNKQDGTLTAHVDTSIIHAPIINESPTSQSLESCSSPSSQTPTPTSSVSSTPVPISSSPSSSSPQPVHPIIPLTRKRPVLLSSSHLSSIHSSSGRSSVTSSPTPSISSQDSICSSPRSRQHIPVTLGKRSRSSRSTSTEMRRRRHRYKDGLRYHSLKEQLDNLREVTLEFQTVVTREWETRTEEWSQDKKNNKQVLDRIRESRPDCGRAVLLQSASAMIRHLNNEVTVLRAKIVELQGDIILSPQEPSDADLTACMDAMIRLAHDQHMLQMGGCMITQYSMHGVIMDTNDISCQYGYTQQAVIGSVCTSTPYMEEAAPLPPTVDISTTTAKQLMTIFLPTSTSLVTPWWQHMLLVPLGMVVPFISRRHTPQGQYEINIYWRQVEQGLNGIRSIYSVGWDAIVEFMPIPTTLLTSTSTSNPLVNGVTTPLNGIINTSINNIITTPINQLVTTPLNAVTTSTPITSVVTTSTNGGIS